MSRHGEPTRPVNGQVRPGTMDGILRASPKQQEHRMSEQAQQPKLEFVDRPELVETFVDSVRGVMFDGSVLRVELCVTRLANPGTAGGQASMTWQPACRLVLTASGAVELFNQLQQVMGALAQQGVVKRNEASAQNAAPAS